MEKLWYIKATRVGGNPGWVVKRDLSVIPMKHVDKPDVFNDEEKVQAQKVLQEFGYTVEFILAEEASELRFRRALATGR